MSEHLLVHLQALIGERHPISSPEKLKKAEHYLIERFRQLAVEVELHSFEALGGTYRNVIATVGARQQAPPLILAAHYDTVEGSPGADDNASGLAVLLDVAHQLSRASLQRPVRFIAFCLEEEDLLGSLAYAAQLRDTGQTILGAIILECVGYASHQEGSQTIPPGVPIAVPSTGDFLAVIGNERSQALTGSVTHAMTPHLPIVPLIVPGNGESLPDTRRSDHTAFWEQGFPAIMLTDTANYRNPHYHQPTDTVETLNLDFLASVTDAVTAAVLEVAGRRELS